MKYSIDEDVFRRHLEQAEERGRQKELHREAEQNLGPSPEIPLEAIKRDQEKNPLGLISPVALAKVGQVMRFGAEKYDTHNWRKGFEWQRLIDAALRHINAFNMGLDRDPESGLSHIAHAACMLMFLLEHEEEHLDLDNRYKVSRGKNWNEVIA